MDINIIQTNIKCSINGRAFKYKVDHGLLLNYNGFCDIINQTIITDKPLKIGLPLNQALSKYDSVKWYNSLSEFKKVVEKYD